MQDQGFRVHSGKYQPRKINQGIILDVGIAGQIMICDHLGTVE